METPSSFIDPITGEKYYSKRKSQYQQRSYSHGDTYLSPDASDKKRTEGLKNIHAQSSAETSGLGDSLQRIHAFSSTETSGYGEGDLHAHCATPSPDRPYNSGLVPRDSITHDPLRYSSGQTMPELADRPQADRNYMRQNSIEVQKSRGIKQKATAGYVPVSGDHLYTKNQSNSIYGYGNDYNATTEPNSNTQDGVTRVNQGVDNAKQSTSYNTHKHIRGSRDKPRNGSRSHDGRKMSIDVDLEDHFDDAQSHRSVESYVYETPRAASTENLARSDSKTLTRVPSSSFLGADLQSSTWLKWSQDRRASFKRRLDTLEQRQKELEDNRVSTPVLKARKESVMFVSPALEDIHVSKEENNIELNAKLARYMPSGLTRKRGEGADKEENKLSLTQWNALVSFWEHGLFVKARYCGIVIAFISLILAVISITNQQWSIYENHDLYGASYAGLWLICSSIPTGNNCTTSFDREYNVGLWDRCIINTTALGTIPVTCQLDKPNWQIAVIGLLVFAIAFGFLATMLAICGICTTSLPRKVYYYHSSGEIYLICAFATVAALLIYPIATEAEIEGTEHKFGYGYGLGWGSTFLYVASALCMCLDDIVRGLTRGCLCCRTDPNSRLI